jgi:hypothetical protein
VNTGAEGEERQDYRRTEGKSHIIVHVEPICLLRLLHSSLISYLLHK